MLNERGGLRQPFPPSPLLPPGTGGHTGCRRHARRQGARADTHAWGGYNRVLIPPPPSRALADIFGDISRRLTAARAGSSAKGEGIAPPPPPRGGRGSPPRGGGGQDQGTAVDPHPHPSGGGAQGAEAATSAAQVEQDPPLPQGAVPGQPRLPLPPSPPQKRAPRVGGNE